jgi:hypothetical protein
MALKQKGKIADLQEARRDGEDKTAPRLFEADLDEHRRQPGVRARLERVRRQVRARSS